MTEPRPPRSTPVCGLACLPCAASGHSQHFTHLPTNATVSFHVSDSFVFFSSRNKSRSPYHTPAPGSCLLAGRGGSQSPCSNFVSRAGHIFVPLADDNHGSPENEVCIHLNLEISRGRSASLPIGRRCMRWCGFEGWVSGLLLFFLIRKRKKLQKAISASSINLQFTPPRYQNLCRRVSSVTANSTY